MMVASDFNFKILLENFGFLNSFKGRGLFNLYCGTNLWMLMGNTDNKDDNNMVGM